MSLILFSEIIFFPSLSFSFLNSRFGRKRATQIPMVLMLIFTVVTGLSPNIYVYLTSQFIVGVALGGFRINSIILGMRQYWCFQPLSGYLHWLLADWIINVKYQITLSRRNTKHYIFRPYFCVINKPVVQDYIGYITVTHRIAVFPSL